MVLDGALSPRRWWVRFVSIVHRVTRGRHAGHTSACGFECHSSQSRAAALTPPPATSPAALATSRSRGKLLCPCDPRCSARARPNPATCGPCAWPGAASCTGGLLVALCPSHLREGCWKHLGTGRDGPGAIEWLLRGKANLNEVAKGRLDDWGWVAKGVCHEATWVNKVKGSFKSAGGLRGMSGAATCNTNDAWAAVVRQARAALVLLTAAPAGKCVERVGGALQGARIGASKGSALEPLRDSSYRREIAIFERPPPRVNTTGAVVRAGRSMCAGHAVVDVDSLAHDGD